MKRLLLALTVITGLAVGAVPIADAAPASKCSRKELLGVKGGTEGIGASDIITGGFRYSSDDPEDPTSTRRFSAEIGLADGACSGIRYHLVVADQDGNTVFQTPAAGLAGVDGSTTVTFASGTVLTADSLEVYGWTSSALDDELDRAPDSSSVTVALDAGGGQSYH